MTIHAILDLRRPLIPAIIRQDNGHPEIYRTAESARRAAMETHNLTVDQFLVVPVNTSGGE